MYESREVSCLAALFILSPLHFLLPDYSILNVFFFFFCCFITLSLLHYVVAALLFCHRFSFLSLLRCFGFFCRCFTVMLPRYSFCCPFILCYRFIFFLLPFFSRLLFSLLSCFVVTTSYFCSHFTSLFCHQSRRQLTSWSI